MREFTPENIAKELLDRSSVINPSRVADFCAGNGSLLLAAMKKWPESQFYANDWNQEFSSSLKGVSWHSIDFMDLDFDKSFFGDNSFEFDAILLNPPFSTQNSPLLTPRGPVSGISCSTAFAFLFTALSYLKRSGELLAIMPTSTLMSERDKTARRILEERFEISMVSNPRYSRFPGLDISTYLISVRPKYFVSFDSKYSIERPDNPINLKIIRGNISVRREDRFPLTGLHGWLHTSGIRNSIACVRYELPEDVNLRSQFVLPRNSLIVPRVGRLRPGDIMVSSRREILSDCLFGVPFDSSEIAKELFFKIKNDFDNFSKIYSGTAAPYTTKERLCEWIFDALSKERIIKKSRTVPL